MEILTDRQQQVLDFIRHHLDAHGLPPTRAEIARALGFSSGNAAEVHLRALERKGAIELIAHASRGIRLSAMAQEFTATATGLPLIGRIAAGSPILAEQNIEARYQLDERLFGPHADYLLRVQGQSLRDAGILDGDLLVVRCTPEACNGQIVVARIDDEVTVKRFERTGERVRLLSANPDFAPIEPATAAALVIEGVAVGVIRCGRL